MATNTLGLRKVLIILLTLMLSACNLTTTQDEIETTALPTNTGAPAQATTTNLAQVPTSIVTTALPQPTGLLPTSILPPTQQFVTSTPSLVAISILSPLPGSVVAGNVQIVGSAVHPSFLQYQLEFGPDPNPGNLWFPIGSARLLPVQNNLLGIWSTSGSIPDGVYQLRLRVFLRDGNILQTVVNSISVRNTAPTPFPSATPSIPRPVAGFTSDVTNGFAPLVVRFTDQSTGDITNRNWNFGDGSRNTNRNPRHTFRNPGIYDVRLTVSGPGGQSNFSRRIVVQGSNPPVANFTLSPASGTAPLRVQFTDTSRGDITGHLWNFGDGITTTERNPIHEFTEVGEYNVILEVRGRDGSSSRFTQKVNVVNPQVQPPVADFTPKSQSGEAPLRITFQSTSTGTIESYLWDFGNGDTSTDANPIYQYDEPGTYTVTLTVTNRGGPSTTTGTITVNRPPQAPTADFNAAPTSGNAPLAVQFTDNSSGTITEREWNFGDGTVITGEVSPTHMFGEPGTYTVRLTLIGEGDTSDFHEVSISVTEPLAPPTASFAAEPIAGPAPLTVQFTNQSTGDGITSRWDFGDGNTSDNQEAILTHEYAAPGEYAITLTVSGPGGPESVATGTITVTDALRAAFSAAPTTQPAGLSLQFTDESSGNPTAWAWDFGDGQSSTQQNPQHTYDAAGTYTVTLTISNADGSQSAQQTITVTEPPTPPQAAFEIASVDGLEVRLADRSTGNIAGWQWDFGDGTGVTAIEQNPVYAYQAAGTYTITLTVSNEAGQSQASQEITVAEAVQPPVASFNVALDGQNASFTDTSTNAPTSWAWDFGDGQISAEQNPTHAYAPGTYTVTLTVGNAGGTATTSQPLTIEAPAQPPVADFAFRVDGLNVEFADQSTPTGSITAWAWDFGDGLGFSAEQNPRYIYGGANLYTVRLTVTGSDGQIAQVEKQVEIAQQVQPPLADFTYTVEGNVVTFADASTGEPATWAWQFGDGAGSTSEEQNPTFDYAAPGTYTVTLTVSNAGGSNATQQEVIVEAGDTLPEESIADTTPVLPDIEALAERLRPVFQSGGKRADVFAVAGGREVSQESFLRPFGDGQYTLRNDGEAVRRIIEWYSAADLNSFAQVASSVAILPEASAGEMANNPAAAGACDGSETALACELRLTGAGVVVIGIGYRDARSATNPEQFRRELQTLVSTALDNGVIPVLLTPYSRPGEEDVIRRIAEVVIEVAEENEVPVLNVWRLLNETTGGGLVDNAPSVSPEGADVLANALIRDFGENARTYNLLRLLSDLYDRVLN